MKCFYLYLEIFHYFKIVADEFEASSMYCIPVYIYFLVIVLFRGTVTSETKVIQLIKLKIAYVLKIHKTLFVITAGKRFLLQRCRVRVFPQYCRRGVSLLKRV